MELQELGQIASSVGVPGLLTFAVWAFYKGHVVPGREYQEVKDALKEATDASRDANDANAALARMVPALLDQLDAIERRKDGDGAAAP